MDVFGYYYLHENGDLIYKPYDDGRVADFRESPFVKAFWAFDRERETAWTMLIEAQAAGARINRIKELAEQWRCNDADAAIYAQRVGVTLTKEGDNWRATGPNSLEKDISGNGPTCLDAMAQLAKASGYAPSKMWGNTFKSVIGSKGA